MEDLQKTEMGLIPRDWNMVEMSKLILTFRGGAPLAPSDFTSEGVKVLPKIGVIRGGVLNIEKSKQQYCSQKYADEHSNNIVFLENYFNLHRMHLNGWVRNYLC